MRVLLLGSNGLMATTIGRYCQYANIEVDVVGRSFPRHYPCRRYIVADLMHVRPCDLDGLDIAQYDLIVYAAGAGVQSNLRENPDQIYSLNVSFPVGLLSHLKKICFKGAVVTFGSYFEIGENNEHREWTEEDILSSLRHVPNDYCVSKRILTRFASSCDVSFTYYHLILPTVYAEYESTHRLIPCTIESIKKGVVGSYTFGNQLRQYVNARDVVTLILSMIERKVKAGIYNVPAGDTLTVQEVVREIYHAMNLEMPRGCFGKAVRDDSGMANLRLNSYKLQSVMGGGWKPCCRISSYVRALIRDVEE